MQGRCPFGYTADDDDDDNEEGVEDSGIEDEGSDGERHVKSKKKSEEAGEGGKSGAFSYEKDPMSWFFQNQIRSEKEFQEKKVKLRGEAKKRLEQIMQAKKKLLEFDSDFDDEDGSIHSSELSELDSDVHSLSSLKSCAESWIEEASYNTAAEGWVKWATPAATAVTCACLYQSYYMISVCSKATGLVLNTHWPVFCMSMATLMIVAAGIVWFAACWRSKRLLISGQIMMLIVYAISAGLIAAMLAKPIQLDLKLQDVACNKMDNRDIGSRLCNTMPKVGRDVAEALPPLMWSVGAVGLGALVITGLGIWYTYELAYVEKKACKFKRRHRRRKHTIPWHKIKIVGPVLNCGANSLNKPGAASSGGKCPMGFSSEAKDKTA